MTSFDLSKIEEQEKCFNYSNLQPLWAKENLSKNNKFIPPPKKKIFYDYSPFFTKLKTCLYTLSGISMYLFVVLSKM